MRLPALYERKTFIFSALLLYSLIFQSCIKEYSLENGSTTGLVTGTLNCSSTSVHGKFYKGFAAQTDSTFLELGVNVTQPGYYHIATDLQNGFSFADSGFFTTTGINTILLKPVGTPVSATITNFSVRFDSSVCNVEVNVLDSTVTTGAPVDPDTLTTNSWIFTANGHTYFGPVTTGDFGHVNHQLFISGPTQYSHDTLFTVAAIVPGTILGKATYITLSDATFFDFDNLAASGNILIYGASDLNTAQVVTIEVTRYDEATKTMTGIFSGNSYDINDNRVPITNGAFKAVIKIIY